MRKIERLEWIRKNFGEEYVLRYFYCNSWEEIEEAIQWFESRSLTWGMRTEWVSQGRQRWQCPFLFRGTKEEAKKIWQDNKQDLEYIICKNILEVKLNAVAWLVSMKDEAVFIEFNDKDTEIAQRDMYDQGKKNLTQIYISPGRPLIVDGKLVHCYLPEDSFIVDRRFNEIYKLILQTGVEELTFSLLPNNKIVIW